MTNRRVTVGLIAILAAAAGYGLLGGPATGRTSADPAADRARTQLAALQAKMPGLFDRWWAGAVGEGKLKTELKLLRWVGPAEVKLTYRLDFSVEGDIRVDGDVVVTVVLRYYDGRWTTTDVRSNNPKVVGADLMLLVDQASPE